MINNLKSFYMQQALNALPGSFDKGPQTSVNLLLNSIFTALTAVPKDNVSKGGDRMFKSKKKPLHDYVIEYVNDDFVDSEEVQEVATVKLCDGAYFLCAASGEVLFTAPKDRIVSISKVAYEQDV